MKTCRVCQVDKTETDFHVGRATCKPCISAANKVRYAANAEWRKNYYARDDVKSKRAALQREWKSTNPDKNAEIKQAWKQANPDAVAAERKRWKANNPGTLRAQKAKRRAAKLQATPAWANSAAIVSIYEDAARLRSAGHDVHVDHIIPLINDLVCGLHVEHNLQILSAKENCSKSNRF